MNTILIILIVYLILNTIIWVVRHLSLSRSKRSAEVLDSKFNPVQPEPLPKLSVLVAAKNEEKNIERCLRSLVAQDYPDLEIIAVNDRSTDRTEAIMDRLAAESGGRLKVIHIRELPSDWLGKPHALFEGQKQAAGQYLMFTDADCFFQCPDALRIGVQFAREKQVDLLSIMPVSETSTFWERVLQPVCSGILIVWFRPEWVNDPGRKVAYANGAYMLFTRECYDRVGGHTVVREYLMEDLAFSRLVKGGGMRLYVVPNRDLYRVRMYEGFKATFNGWSRIFYGAFARASMIVGALAMLTIMSLLPYLVLLVALGAAIIKNWDMATRSWHAFAWSGVAILAQQSVLFRFYPAMGTRWYRALAYPLGAGVAFFILLNSLKKILGGPIVWRGTPIVHKDGKLSSTR